jgi:hypothetical protein
MNVDVDFINNIRPIVASLPLLEMSQFAHASTKNVIHDVPFLAEQLMLFQACNDSSILSTFSFANMAYLSIYAVKPFNEEFKKVYDRLVLIEYNTIH